MLTPYPLQTNNEFSFEFVTGQRIRYVVYFSEASSFFVEYPDISKKIYWFNIVAREGDPDESRGDERIGSTVLEVFKIFFESIENVAMYYCDTSDKREKSRQRKFNLWFWRYNDGTIIKENGEFLTEASVIYYSILVHRNNPFSEEIMDAFRRFAAE